MGVTHTNPLAKRIERMDPAHWAKEARRAAVVAKSLAEQTGRAVPDSAVRILGMTEDELIAERSDTRVDGPEYRVFASTSGNATTEGRQRPESATEMQQEWLLLLAEKVPKGEPFVVSRARPLSAPPLVGRTSSVRADESPTGAVSPDVQRGVVFGSGQTETPETDYRVVALREAQKVLHEGKPELAKLLVEVVLQADEALSKNEVESPPSEPF